MSGKRRACTHARASGQAGRSRERAARPWLARLLPRSRAQGGVILAGVATAVVAGGILAGLLPQGSPCPEPTGPGSTAPLTRACLPTPADWPGHRRPGPGPGCRPSARLLGSTRRRVMPEPTYQEGDWFAVPLRGGCFAAGIIARAMPRKEGVLPGCTSLARGVTGYRRWMSSVSCPLPAPHSWRGLVTSASWMRHGRWCDPLGGIAVPGRLRHSDVSRN